jgi:hypothetical protein
MNRLALSLWILLCFAVQIAQAQTKKGIEYPYATAEPQKTGWPLTPEEKAYVTDKSGPSGIIVGDGTIAGERNPQQCKTKSSINIS